LRIPGQGKTCNDPQEDRPFDENVRLINNRNIPQKEEVALVALVRYVER